MPGKREDVDVVEDSEPEREEKRRRRKLERREKQALAKSVVRENYINVPDIDSIMPSSANGSLRSSGSLSLFHFAPQFYYFSSSLGLPPANGTIKRLGETVGEGKLSGNFYENTQ
jgi:hypothetical protein